MYIRMSKKWAMILLAAAVVLVGSIAWFMNSAQRVDVLLKHGECEQAVALMNEHTYSKKDMDHLEFEVREYIDTTIDKWDEETISYEDAKTVLVAFIQLNNDKVSGKAQEKLDYIELENSCNIALQSAEKAYDDQNYIDAMVTLTSIEKSYSRYIIADDLYDECKSLLLDAVNDPVTVSDYETSIE